MSAHTLTFTCDNLDSQLIQNRSTVEEPNEVYTGVNDTDLVGRFIEWNNNTEISGWGTPNARRINGTGGFMFHPGVSRNENLTVFVTELYR